MLRLDLYVQKEQRLVPFTGSKVAPGSVVLTAAQATACDIRAPPALGDQCVLEMCLQAGAWHPLRRRWDRTHPNTLTTVRENIDLHKHGHCDPKALLSALRCRRGVRQNDIDQLRQRILEAAGTAVAAAGGSETQALFLPDCESLERTLSLSAPKEHEAALTLVVITLPAPYEEQARAAAAAAPAASVSLDRVVCAARASGWKCREQKQVRGEDFLHGVRLPPHVDSVLRNLRFLLLTPRAPPR